MFRFICIHLLLLGISVGLFAQEGESLSEDTSNTFALIVGVSKYESPDITPLNFAHIDAQKFADYLHSPAGGHVPAENIRLLVNEEAKFGEFAKELTWLIKTAGEGDRAIIFFSGHAMVENEVLKKGYLQLHNSNNNLFSNNAFAFDDLNRAVAMLNSKDSEQGGGAEVILIFDACRSGTIREEAAALQIRDGFDNTIRLLSCQPDQDSEEGKQWGGGRGAFSYHLIEGLVGKADQNKDTEVTLLELMTYLTTTVPKEVKDPQVPVIEAMDASKLMEAIAFVDPETLAQLNEKHEFKEPVMSRSKKKGTFDVIQRADALVRQWYAKFEARLDEEKLFRPEEDCAEFYYNQLMQQNELESLHSFLTANYAAVLQDATVTIYKKLADADSLQQARIFKEDTLFLTYPRYLNRAIELLGSDHYMHQTLTARKDFFEGLIRQIKYQEDGKREEDLQAAIKSQTRAIGIQRDNAHAYSELGKLHSLIMEYEIAIEYLDIAIELSPEFAFAYAARGEVFYKTGAWEKAKADFEKVLELVPDDMEYRSVVFVNLALVGIRMEQPEASRQWLYRAMEYIDEVGVEYQLFLKMMEAEVYVLMAGRDKISRQYVFSTYQDTSLAALAIPAYQKMIELGECGIADRMIETMVRLRRPANQVESVFNDLFPSCSDEEARTDALFYLAGFFYEDKEKGLNYFDQLFHQASGMEDAETLVRFIMTNTSASNSSLIPYWKYFLETDPNMPWKDGHQDPSVKTLEDALDKRFRGKSYIDPLIPVIYQYYPENKYPFNAARQVFYTRKEWKKEAKKNPRFSIDYRINWWQQMIGARPEVAVHYFQLATILYEWERYEEAETYARKYYALEKEDEEGILLLRKILKKNGKKEEVKSLDISN
jgi:tetratricopeptide (TPR) repeat protein